MAELLAGNNVTSFAYESGLYGETSGTAQWIGLVTNFDSDDTENVQRVRYHGTGDRNVAASLPGARDYSPVVEFYPQDFKFLMFALGTGSDLLTGSPAYYTHLLNELNLGSANPMTSGTRNPFLSFALENAQQHVPGGNLVRTYRGCVVNSYTLAKTDNSEPLMCTAECLAQSLTPSSGSPTFGAPVENTRRPHAPFDSRIHLPSGTLLDAKTWEFSINNNFDRDGAHICNGSREIASPSPTERDYGLVVTVPAQSAEAMRLNGLARSGGSLTENAALEIINYGKSASGLAWIALSGCDVDIKAPSPVEGINEWELILTPKSCNAIIQDDTEKYLLW
jgi:hypothetical protein